MLLYFAPVRGEEFIQIAVSGESASGMRPGEMYREFANTPVIDNGGQVAFSASLEPEPSKSSVWIASSIGLRMIAESGEPAPGTGASFAQFSDVLINGGLVALKANLVGSAIDVPNHESIWVDRFGSLALVTQVDQKAPSPNADLRFSHIETPIALNPVGETAFFARTRDKEGDNSQSSGIWKGGSTGVAFAANAQAENISGLPGVTFSPQSFEQPFANNPILSPAGETIFRGFLAGTGVNDSNLNSLWSYSDTAKLRLLQRAGDDAVGMQGAKFVSFPSVPTINAAGDTAFLAFVNKTEQSVETIGTDAVHPTSETEHGLGLWLRRSAGELSHIFAVGDNSPGIVPSAHFVDIFDPVMNSSSRIALLAVVAGDSVNRANEVGLWSNGMSSDGSLKLIARQGDHAPGGNQDFVFGTFLEPSINAAGQTAFMALGYQLENGSVVDSAFGIWGEDRAGVLRLVARVGQEITLDPNDHRRIASLSFVSESGGEDGRGRGLNDLGQIVFHATFADGSSGIFVSNALTVPEPYTRTTLAFAAGCFASIYQTRRRENH